MTSGRDGLRGTRPSSRVAEFARRRRTGGETSARLREPQGMRAVCSLLSFRRNNTANAVRHDGCSTRSRAEYESYPRFLVRTISHDDTDCCARSGIKIKSFFFLAFKKVIQSGDRTRGSRSQRSRARDFRSMLNRGFRDVHKKRVHKQ